MFSGACKTGGETPEIVNPKKGGILNLPFDFDRALEGLIKVTLRGGLVGKVTFSVVVVSLAMATIAWSVKNLWLSLGALAAVFLLAFVMLWRLINFADRNPQAALLEGAEFLMHEQIVHATKSNPTLSAEATVQVQPEAIEGQLANPEIADIPDEEVIEAENIGGNR